MYRDTSHVEEEQNIGTSNCYLEGAITNRSMTKFK